MFSLNSGSNPTVVKTEIDEVLYTEFDYPVMPGTGTALTPELFKQGTLSNAADIYVEFRPSDKFESHLEEEEVDEETIDTGNKTTQNVVNYKKDLPIAKELYDDEQHDLVNNAVTSVGREAKNTRDQKAFDVYGDGFATGTTPDGAYLWSDTHTNLNRDTIDNLSSGAMTPTTLKTLVRMLYVQKNQRGRLGGHNPVALLVSPTDFPKATEYVESELKPDSTDNNLNYFSRIYPGMKVFTSPWLDSTYHSYANINTAHYLVSRNHFLRRKVREGINTSLLHWKYDKKDRWMYKVRYREVSYAGTWEGCVASTGI